MSEKKLRVDLVAPEMIEAIADVLGKAAESGKYPARSWENDPTYSYTKHISSAFRHLLAIIKGEDIDDDGLLHSDHLATRAGMLATMQRRGRTDLDDRPVNMVKDDYNPLTAQMDLGQQNISAVFKGTYGLTTDQYGRNVIDTIFNNKSSNDGNDTPPTAA